MSKLLPVTYDIFPSRVQQLTALFDFFFLRGLRFSSDVEYSLSRTHIREVTLMYFGSPCCIYFTMGFLRRRGLFIIYGQRHELQTKKSLPSRIFVHLFVNFKIQV